MQELGHTFSSIGISPDPKKIINVVVEWPIPTNVSFLDWHHTIGDISHTFPTLLLHCIFSQTGVTFAWSPDCNDAFNSLKQHLSNAPVLAYPSFSPTSSEFVLQTDASVIGLEAVLEQQGHPIAYASRNLTRA